MDLIQWTDEYSVGVPELDKQHKALVDLINRLATEGHRPRVIPVVLDELDRYAKDHFRVEEAFVRATRPQDLEEHQRQHRAFEEWLHAAREVYRFSNTAPDPFVVTLNSFLRNWLINHILKTDMAYKPH